DPLPGLRDHLLRALRHDVLRMFVGFRVIMTPVRGPGQAVGTRSFGERTWGASSVTRAVRLPDGVEPDEALPAADAMLPPQEDPAVARTASWLARLSTCGAKPVSGIPQSFRISQMLGIPTVNPTFSYARRAGA